MLTMTTNYTPTYGTTLAGPVGDGEGAIIGAGVGAVVLTALAGLAVTGLLVWGGVKLVKHVTK